MLGLYDQIQAAAAKICSVWKRPPHAGIILGTGLGNLAAQIEVEASLDYEEIPNFLRPTATSHRGRLVCGTLGGLPVIAMEGRFHMYEGYSADAAALPVRVFAALGIRTLVVTNAAGGIRRTYGHGTIMLISDHLNLTGRNPLVGHQRGGEERFPDMTDAYDPGYRGAARAAARRLGITLEEGVYAGLLGPSYETPSEVRMLERLGADAVGMSTVVEVIAARALGMRCLGFSLVTNPGAGISPVPLSHAEVMDIAGKAGGELARLVEGVIESL